MSLKILHTGDLHIGMKFNGYPDSLRQQLTEARFGVLDTLVQRANDTECHLLVIAGDLFDKTTVPAREVERVAATLDKFAGDCVLVLPGNHDYDNGLGGLWGQFQNRLTGKILLLNECKPYHLQAFDLDVAVYPAPCQRKHSRSNNLDWMSSQFNAKAALWHIGLAHGALEGLSPDLNQEYFPMSRKELEAIPLDLWLLGHAHIPYPVQLATSGQKIYNAGTPEPDGLDCKHEGHAWLLEIDENKSIRGILQTVGNFRFLDETKAVNDIQGLEKIRADYSNNKASRTILRLNLAGVLEPETYVQKGEYYRILSEELAHFRVEDEGLRVRITTEIIDREFTAGSFPQRFLNEFLHKGDQEALQLAYEMLQEVKKP